jgi:hypothetical protein
MSEQKRELIEGLKEKLVTTSDISFLDKFSEEDLSSIDKLLTDYIHQTNEAQRPVYEVMAKATAFVPNMIISKLAQDYLSPYIISQVTPFLDAKASAKIGKSLKPEFLGKVTIYVEPSLTADIANNMGMPHIYNVFREMSRMEYFLRLGEISDLIKDHLLKSVLTRMKDVAAIARIVEHMKNDAKVKVIVDQLDSSGKAQVRTYLESVENHNATRF